LEIGERVDIGQVSVVMGHEIADIGQWMAAMPIDEDQERAEYMHMGQGRVSNSN